MKTILVGLSLIILTSCIPDLQEITIGGWKITYMIGGFLIGWGIREEHVRWKNNGDHLD